MRTISRRMSARDVREFLPFTTRVCTCALSVGESVRRIGRKGKAREQAMAFLRKATSKKRKDNHRGKRSEQRRGKLHGQTWTWTIAQVAP